MGNVNEQKVYKNFNHYFGNITDPRQVWKIEHKLTEILFITVMATIAGCEDFEEIEEYARQKTSWLISFLELPGGIPSHDTFNRVICLIDPREFEANFISWVSDYAHPMNGQPKEEEKEIIPIDGKTVCNSINKRKGNKAIHMVSALSTKYGLILGQQKCTEKSNEITAIPLLLSVLDVKHSIVTIDAMGCQKKIAEKIIAGGADYILALKDNQGNLYKEVVDFCEKIKQPEFSHYIFQQDSQLDKGHGRIEKRDCITVNNLSWLLEVQGWAGIQSIVKITAVVIKEGKETKEDRYYISSLKGDADQINRAIRPAILREAIENSLHWVLDVTFNEDDCRVKTGHGAENLSIVRRIALNKLKSDTSKKSSLKIKRKLAGWDDNYALKIFNDMMAA